MCGRAPAGLLLLLQMLVLHLICCLPAFLQAAGCGSQLQLLVYQQQTSWPQQQPQAVLVLLLLLMPP